jgi:stress response protein YsnF
MPAIREEGDTIVIPIVEEVLVVERRLFLKEEVRVRRVSSTERHQESVTLRHHEAVVTRLPAEPPAAGEATETGARVEQSKQEE